MTTATAGGRVQRAAEVVYAGSLPLVEAAAVRLAGHLGPALHEAQRLRRLLADIREAGQRLGQPVPDLPAVAELGEAVRRLNEVLTGSA